IMKLCFLYTALLEAFTKEDPTLRRVSEHFPFAATTVNFGPEAICGVHMDYANFISGLCLVIALGVYDHTKGGHIVLHEPKVIVEFAPGDFIFFPSAGITHSNTRIQAGE
ncbi:hypothetical protein BOTBODRAFT_80704, partial [Botryobasidium botryosum FD-172 SS1]